MKDKSSLRYDIADLKGVAVLDAFTELREYSEFTAFGEGEGNALLLFTVWYADPGSEYRDLPLDLKRQQCMKRAGIEADDPRRADIANMRHEGVRKMIVQYIRLIDWLEYATLYHGREHAWQLVSGLSTPMDEDLGDEKEQKAIKTKNENLEFALEKVGELDLRWRRLWLNEDEIQKEAQLMTRNKMPDAERRAAGRSFVPKKP